MYIYIYYYPCYRLKPNIHVRITVWASSNLDRATYHLAAWVLSPYRTFGQGQNSLPQYLHDKNILKLNTYENFCGPIGLKI